MSNLEEIRVAIARQKLAERELARRYLIDFTEQMHGNYTAGAIHRFIGNKLYWVMKKIERKESPRVMLFLPPRFGKICIDSLGVYTYNRGLTTHGDLKVNDLVQHPSGKPTRVMGIFNRGLCDHEVEISNGEKIQCHGNHEWTVYDRGNKKWKTVEAKWFLENTNRGTPRRLTSGVIGKRGGRYMFQLPLVEGPVQMAESMEQSLDPYFLGVWLGDGSKSAPVICFDPRKRQHIDKIEAKGMKPNKLWRHSSNPSYRNVSYVSFSHQGVLQDLRDVGIAGNKHIPECYLNASVDQRLELLAGLIDSDGTVDVKGRVSFVNTNKELIDGYMELCNGLNLRPYMSNIAEPRMTSSGIQGRKVVYTVGFQPPTLEYCPAIPTVVKKIIRLVKPRRHSVAAVRQLDADSLGESDYGHCIQVEASDGLYLVGKSLIPTHNSELASVQLPAWTLGHHPEWEIINASYSTALPLKFSKRIRRTLDSAEYQAIFIDTVIQTDSRAADDWTTTEEGGFRASGVGAGITGRGAHLFIIDDIIKDYISSRSETILDSHEDWYDSTAYTRLAPGAGMLLIMTRWSWADLAGRLLDRSEGGKSEEDGFGEGDSEALAVVANANQDDASGFSGVVGGGDSGDGGDSAAVAAATFGDKWDVIKFPAIAEEYEYIDKHGDETGLEKEWELVVFGTKLSPEEEINRGLIHLRDIGDAAHPERYNERALLSIKNALTPKVWTSLYQQAPTPDSGDFFKAEWFDNFRSIPTAVQDRLNGSETNKEETGFWLSAWDLAIGEKQSNDWTVGFKGYYDMPIGKPPALYVDACRRFRGNSAVKARHMVDWVEQNRSLRVGVENGHILQAMKSTIELEMGNRGIVFRMIELNALTDKVSRAMALQGLLEMGRVFFTPAARTTWMEYMLREATTFPDGANDDMVDALSHLVNMATFLGIAFKKGEFGKPKKMAEARCAGGDYGNMSITKRLANLLKLNVSSSSSWMGK
jgi:predicted phage terminase large subunit-like protein